MDYYVYDKTGRILRTGRTSRKNLKLKEGEFAAKGNANGAKQMVVDGRLVEGQVPLDLQIPEVPVVFLTSKNHKSSLKKEVEELKKRVERLEKNSGEGQK